MKAVFLVSGRGTRMKPLTDTCPKPLLMYQGKSLLDHKLETLPPECDGIIFIIGYLGEMFRERYGNEWRGRKITYVEEPKILGTGYAVFTAKEHLKGERFIVFPGDDIFSKHDVEKIIQYPRAMLVSHVLEGRVSGGKIVYMADGTLDNIVEGTHDAPFYVATGLYVLDDTLFEYPLVQIPERNEFGLPQTVVAYAQNNPIEIIEATQWIQITSPEDLLTK